MSAAEQEEDAAWTGAGRAVWVFALWIQSHDSLLCPARLPAFLAGPGFSPQPSSPFFYLPPDALFDASFTPSKVLPAFCLLSHLSPEAVDDLRMSKKKEVKHGLTDYFMEKLVSLFWI